jgi:hypothetical protein
MTSRQLGAGGAYLALALLHGCAAEGATGAMEDEPSGDVALDPGEGSVTDSVTGALEAQPAPAIFAYHTYDHELEVVMTEAGCYTADTTLASCKDCAAKVSVAKTDHCSAPSRVVQVRVDAPAGLIVTNPVLNTGASDQAICDAELGFQRRFGMSADSLAYHRSRNLAPWYRERAADRASTTDFASCSEAAPRLRAAFYPL